MRRNPASAPAGAAPPVELVAPAALTVLPAPSPGDLYFDFEGDPLYTEAGTWGLDYLFGMVDQHGTEKTYVGLAMHREDAA